MTSPESANVIRCSRRTPVGPRWAEVKLPDEHECRAYLVIATDRPVQRAHRYARKGPSMEAGACGARHRKPIAVAFISDSPAGRQVDQLIGIELIAAIDPQPPVRTGEYEFSPTRAVVLLMQIR